MTSTVIADQWRQHHAAASLDALGRYRADCQVLLIECRRGHTLAGVYACPVGLVFVSHPRPAVLDTQDLGGSSHHRRNRTAREFVDMLASTWSDDDLPAGCYCGDHTLSRLAIESDLAAGRRLVTAT